MLTRSILVRAAWVFLLSPMVIYGFLFLHCMTKADEERRIHRQRLSLWITATNRLPDGANSKKKVLSNSPSFENQDGLPSVPSQGLGIRGLHKGWQEVEQSPQSVDGVNKNETRKIKSMTESEQVDERTAKGLLQEYIKYVGKLDLGVGRNRTRLAKAKYRRTKNTTSNKDEDMDNNSDDVMKTKYYKAGLEGVVNLKEIHVEDVDDDEDDDDDYIINNENVNAGVDRALPDIDVKRYVDEPIDPHEYAYIHSPSNHCLNKEGKPRNVFVLFMVVTAPGHFVRRDLIRKTYGNKDQWPPLKRGVFATVFLLGTPQNATLQKLIEEEASRHRDIVQEDFVDTYANLSRKTVMGLKWVTNHCRHACYTMKIDDDSMINQGRFLWIFKESSLFNWTASEALISAPVLRNTSSKYFISEEYYPAPTYPPYLNGPGYLLSNNLVELTYKMALTTPLFPWEDVFLGTCMAKLGVKPVQHKSFLWISNPYFFRASSERLTVKRLRSFVVVSNLYPEHMELMWEVCKIKLVKPK